MFNQLCKLSLVLVFGLIAWIIYDRKQWDYDYTIHQAIVSDVPHLDFNFDDHFDPKFFKNATVITNQTHLVCPQDLAITNDGLIYTGLQDGSIVSLKPDSNQTTLVSSGEGRIYGLSMTSDQSTIYYLTYKGLFKLDLATKKSQLIKLEIQGGKVGNLNSIAIDNKNKVLYITDAGPIRFQHAGKIFLLNNNMGQIIKYDVNTQQASVLLSQISFPNGIVFHQQTNSIIFSQFNRYRIWKYSLTTNEKTILMDNLFGNADNLKLSDNGDLLIGIVMLRDRLAEFIKDKPQLRKLMMYLPEKLTLSFVKKIAGGIRVNPQNGEIKEYMFGATTKISTTSSIHEKKGKLYFSSVFRPTLLILDKNSKKENVEIQKETGQL